MSEVLLYFDGSCDSNPGGPGGWGWRLERLGGELIACDLERIPAGPGVTNNTAEWAGLLAGLEFLATRKDTVGDVTVLGDSRMVVEQAAGRWKAKAEHLKPLLARSQSLVRAIGRHRFRFHWIPREQNAECDALSKGVGR